MASIRHSDAGRRDTWPARRRRLYHAPVPTLRMHVEFDADHSRRLDIVKAFFVALDYDAVFRIVLHQRQDQFADSHSDLSLPSAVSPIRHEVPRGCRGYAGSGCGFGSGRSAMFRCATDTRPGGRAYAESNSRAEPAVRSAETARPPDSFLDARPAGGGAAVGDFKKRPRHKFGDRYWP